MSDVGLSFVLAFYLVIGVVVIIGLIGWLPNALAGWFGWRKPPIVRRDDPRLIFRLVHREDRGAYVRIMRRTLAVQMRDMNRAMAGLGREIGKAIRPPLEELAAAMSRMFR
jgi:hypothetical protein